MNKKIIAILRTKAEILTARDTNNLIIEKSVLDDKNFSESKMTDLFGFKLKEGSDFKVFECKKVSNDPQAFFDFTFGKIEDSDEINK